VEPTSLLFDSSLSVKGLHTVTALIEPGAGLAMMMFGVSLPAAQSQCNDGQYLGKTIKHGERTTMTTRGATLRPLHCVWEKRVETILLYQPLCTK